MSSREQVLQIVNALPEYKVDSLLGFLRTFIYDEEADEAFCENMYQEYLNDSDRGDFVPLDDAVKEMGLSPDELRNSD